MTEGNPLSSRAPAPPDRSTAPGSLPPSEPVSVPTTFTEGRISPARCAKSGGIVVQAIPASYHERRAWRVASYLGRSLGVQTATPVLWVSARGPPCTSFVLGGNRVQHRHTLCQGLDVVWHARCGAETLTFTPPARAPIRDAVSGDRRLLLRQWQRWACWWAMFGWLRANMPRGVTLRACRRASGARPKHASHAGRPLPDVPQRGQVRRHGVAHQCRRWWAPLGSAALVVMGYLALVGPLGVECAIAAGPDSAVTGFPPSAPPPIWGVEHPPPPAESVGASPARVAHSPVP